jgi:hypothetical protein
MAKGDFMIPGQSSSEHPHTKFLERGQAVRLFPEAKDVFTEMKTAFLFELLRLTMRQGLDNELEQLFGQRSPTIWLPCTAADLIRSTMAGNINVITVLNKPYREGNTETEEVRFIALEVAEFSLLFRELAASGHLDQVLEHLHAMESSVWVNSEYANLFKRFVLEHGLYEVDPRFRMLLQSQTCQCRGKSPGGR